MKLLDFLDQTPLDQPTLTPQALAMRYGVSIEEIIAQLKIGMRVEMEHTTNPAVAREIALDHLGERLDYYEKLSDIDEESVTLKGPNMNLNELTDVEENDSRKVYPGQSSGKLKNYVRRKYGGEIGCKKASMVINDPEASNFYKKRAIWYRSLHCKGNKQIREDDPTATPDAALTIWDIDDTLFKTAAKVLVNTDDGSKKELSSSEFNQYKLGPGESFDFGQFDDAQLFHSTSEPIDQIWKTALETLENIGKRPGSRMVIVTARRDLDDKHKFIDTFRKHGMDMNKVHVFRAGNLNHGSSAANKKAIIRDLLELGNYSETRMFDDHQDNLRAFLELKEEFPHIRFTAFPVGHNGTVGNPVIV